MYSAKSINIRGAADSRVVTHGLFRRHVTRRAKNVQGLRDTTFRFDQSSKTKIGEVRFAFCIEQNIPRFDITMKNSMFMRVMNNACDLSDQFHCLPDRHWRLFNYFVKLAAFYKLHAEVTLAITLANFMDCNDTRMLQVSRCFRFEPKALQVGFACPL